MSKSYAELKQELDEVLDQIQADKIDIDDALELYDRGQKLIDELQQKIKTAENTIKKVKK